MSTEKKSSEPGANGGARPGAGRKRKPMSVKTVTASITVPPAVLAEIDQRRGMVPRGEWLAREAGVWLE